MRTRDAEQRYATSGGAGDFPDVFQGTPARPRLTAPVLRVPGKVIAARLPLPPALLMRILEQGDPPVTGGGGALRFEGFSAFCSTDARVALNPALTPG